MTPEPEGAGAALARARALSRGRGVLMVEHGWGGGIGTHIDQLTAHLAEEGVQSFRAVPNKDQEWVRLSVQGRPELDGLPELDPAQPSRAAEALRALDLGHVHIHSLVGYPLSWFEPLTRAFAEARLSYDFSCHDYAAICPRLHMVDWGGVYCRNRSEAHCRVCLVRGRPRIDSVDVSAWRDAYRGVLAGARRVFVPDPDMAARLSRYLPELTTIQVRPHPPIRREGPALQVTPPRDREARVIGLIGALGPEKGSNLLLRLAGDALERGLPLRYRLFGYTDRTDLDGFPNLELTGPYTEADIDGRLHRMPPDLLLYPSVAPETFCYALDIAFRTRLKPVCFDLGAPARRIREAGFGTVLPFAWVDHPSRINDALLSIPTGAEGWREERVFPPERRWISASAYYDGGPDVRPGPV